MKTLLRLFALLGLLTFGANVNAQNALAGPVTARDIEIKKIAPAFITTPEFTLSPPINKRAEYLKWLEVEVDFDTKAPLIDELTFSYTVFMNGKLYTGEVTHVNIAKGNSHYSVMYISPKNLEKIAAGKTLSPGMVENIEVEVKRNGMSLGKKATQPKAMPNLERIPGYLSLKSDTPFHVLWWDRYEAVKPSVAR